MSLLEDIWGWIRGPLVSVFVKIVTALIIFLIGRWLIKKAHGLLERVLARKGQHLDKTIATFIGSVFKFALNFLLFVIVINSLGVDNSSFIAIAAAGVFALAFALQGSMANFAAGFVLLTLRPFNVEDYVTVVGTQGFVKLIGMFYCEVRDDQGRLMMIPNGNITSDTITNWSRLGMMRADLNVGIGYGDDMRVARDVCMMVMRAHPLVLEDPAPTVVMANLGDSSVDLTLHPYISTTRDKHDSGDATRLAFRYWRTRWELLEQVKVAFDEAGISIPFPQRDVHFFNEDTRVPKAVEYNTEGLRQRHAVIRDEKLRMLEQRRVEEEAEKERKSTKARLSSGLAQITNRGLFSGNNRNRDGADDDDDGDGGGGDGDGDETPHDRVIEMDEIQ